MKYFNLYFIFSM